MFEVGGIEIFSSLSVFAWWMGVLSENIIFMWCCTWGIAEGVCYFVLGLRGGSMVSN